MKKQILSITLCSLIVPFFSCTAKAPKLTVILVIDQFSAHFIPKLRPFLTGGIRFLSDEGTTFVNAYYDHCMPATGPGHTLLSTGTYGSFHGIINNSWFSKEGKSVDCDDDTAEHAAVFAPNGGLYSYGKSAENMMVDNLSDQLILHSYPHANNTVWSISLKSRSAIAMAGRLGKPIWLDTRSGNFTSSKAYFDELPEWVTEFNKKHDVGEKTEVTWKTFFEDDNKAYSFNNMDNYQFTIFDKSILNRPLTTNFNQEKADKTFERTPQANQLLLDAAYECVEKHFTNDENDRLIMWVSMSGFDMVGHIFGPDSKEMIDLLYHIDHQLKDFMDKIYQCAEKEDVLFVLTGDHAGEPIPEVVACQGMTLARRYFYPQIVDNLNQLIEKKHSVKNVVQNFKEPQFYLNQAIMATLTPDTLEAICQDIKQYMLSLPGIRHAWTFDELKNEVFADYDLDKYIQRQLYRGRSGQVIYSLNPYTSLFSYEPKGKKGMTHHSQYSYDTHVPLIFYQKDHIEKKRVIENVYIPQVSVSLATLFEVPRPSAAAANVLPELPL